MDMQLYRRTTVTILKFFTLLIFTAIAIQVGGASSVRAADDIRVTNPGSYPNWTIVSSEVVTTTTRINHGQTRTHGCSSGGSQTRGSTTTKTTTVSRNSMGVASYSTRTTTVYPPNQSNVMNCTEVINLAWTEVKDVDTRWYTMRQVPFMYTPKTTVDKRTSRAGDIVTFSHTITGTGTPPSTAPAMMTTSFTRTGAEYDYNFGTFERIRCGLNPTSCYFDNRSSMLPTVRNQQTRLYETKVTIGKDTPENVRICYFTAVSPFNQDGGTRRSEDDACTIVKKAENLSFDLVPSVEAVVAGPAEPGTQLELAYNVENKSNTAESSDVVWSTYGIEANPGVDVRPITDGDRRESTNPQALIAALGGGGRARVFDENKYRGTTRFAASRTTQVAREPFQVPSNAAIGSRFCFLLVVTPPTQETSPTNRHSQAKCVIVGKKPKVNIWGGDLYVGRRFANDPVSPSSLESTIRTSISIYGGTNRAYGSWSEYDAHAPGEVDGFATASGLQGGRETTAPGDQSQWSKLTFANGSTKYGEYGSTSARGIIPDAMTAATRDAQIARTLSNIETSLSLNDTNSATQKIARYDKPTGDLTLAGGTLQRGKSVVITVPKGTVTITGDLNYASGQYASAAEIPQLIILAKNIVIKDTVTRIDGWLVAKAPADTPSGTDGSDPANPIGVINTCDIEGPLTINICNQRLTVNGPVMANQILLRRTAGLAGPVDGAGAPSNDTPAEVFNLRADTYLWIYSQGKNNTRAITTYSRELGPRF